MFQSQIPTLYHNEKTKHSFFRRSKIDKLQHQFNIHTHSTVKRKEIECYISQIFKQTHQANIHHFMPILLEVSLQDTPQAAIGLTPGNIEHFFLEQYLSSSAEAQISAVTHQPIERHSIIEIGNLVFTNNGSGLILFSLMASILNKSNYRWIIFTATNEVKHLLERLNITLIPIAVAQPNAEQTHWGSYYDHNPKVMVSDLKKIISDNRKILDNINNRYHKKLYHTSLV